MPVQHLLLRTTSMIVLLTTAYCSWPAKSPTADVHSATRWAGAMASLGLVEVVVWMEVRASRRVVAALAALEGLLAVLYCLVVVFASVYYAMAHVGGQFAGLETKTDGLYFTVTVPATVGFGDIHAVSSTARLLVTAQMLFGLIYIGTAVRLLTSTDLWARLSRTRQG